MQFRPPCPSRYYNSDLEGTAGAGVAAMLGARARLLGVRASAADVVKLTSAAHGTARAAATDVLVRSSTTHGAANTSATDVVVMHVGHVVLGHGIAVLCDRAGLEGRVALIQGGHLDVAWKRKSLLRSSKRRCEPGGGVRKRRRRAVGGTCDDLVVIHKGRL
jgi:hypothetical protein